MRFAIAITILSCQPVPVLAESTTSTRSNELDVTHSHVQETQLLSDSMISSHLLRKSSFINSATKNRAGSLLKNPKERRKETKECNPGDGYGYGGGGGVGDIGILGCGIKEYCIESHELSSLGGICIPKPDLSRTLQLYATPEEYCDPNSIFYENCDCSQFDHYLNQGSIICSPVDYYCIYDNLCGGITTAIERTPEGLYYSEVCYNISYPYDIPICYQYDSRPTCSISVGDIECKTCNVVDVADAFGISYGCFEFDCTNTIANLTGNDCRFDYITKAVSQVFSNISPSSLSLVPTEPTASTVPPSRSPTPAPSSVPPTHEPTPSPKTPSPTTPFPTVVPTSGPIRAPTSDPTLSPTHAPLPLQTSTPTSVPSSTPTFGAFTAFPTPLLTSNPSISSLSPTTESDSRVPELPSSSASIPIPISSSPTPTITTPPSSSTATPTTSSKPSNAPSGSPLPTSQPSMSPSLSGGPTTKPSINPSSSPSSSNTPTSQPSIQPSESVSPSSSNAPTSQPSIQPSESVSPSSLPTSVPSFSLSPSKTPSISPSESITPTLQPSLRPSTSARPSVMDSQAPSSSVQPGLLPSSSHSSSNSPTDKPSSVPSSLPSSREENPTPATPVISGPSSPSPVAALVSEKESINSSSSQRSQSCCWEIQTIIPVTMFVIFLYNH